MTAVVIGVGCAYGIMGRGELIEYVAVSHGIKSNQFVPHKYWSKTGLILMFLLGISMQQNLLFSDK